MYKLVIKEKYKKIFNFPDSIGSINNKIIIHNKILPPINPTGDDIVGTQFNRLLIIAYIGRHRNRKIYLCRCNCLDGNERIVSRDNILNGNTQSCGCIQRENVSNSSKTHGLSKVPEYRIWKAMKERCYNLNNKHYSDYGGRGILIYDGWINDFKSFYDYIGKRPSNIYSIDRIDNDKGYIPGNVRWVTMDIQTKNQRVRKDNVTGHKGITIYKGKYYARIGHDSKNSYIGSYDVLEDAITARCQAESQYWIG